MSKQSPTEEKIGLLMPVYTEAWKELNILSEMCYPVFHSTRHKITESQNHKTFHGCLNHDRKSAADVFFLCIFFFNMIELQNFFKCHSCLSVTKC